MIELIYTPTSSLKSSYFPTIFPTLNIIRLLNFDQIDGYEIVSCCGFSLNFHPLFLEEEVCMHSTEKTSINI